MKKSNVRNLLDLTDKKLYHNQMNLSTVISRGEY